MSGLIQPIYPWDRTKLAMKKRNQGLGNFILINIVFLYYLLFVFVISGKIYPILRQADINLLGEISPIVSLLRFLVFNWWISIILFFVTIIITFLYTALVTRTRLSLFQTYIEYMKIDTKNQSRKKVFKNISVDLILIAGFSIIIFLVLELFTFALSSLIVTMFIPLIFNLTEVSLGYVFLILLISHIIFFPVLIFFYNRMVTRKMIVTQSIDLNKFLTEDGEVDVEKWQKETWGKKSYTFDWEEEDVFPITCFSCGSIISSNLTVCPICDTDLIKEIEAIEEETDSSDEEDFIEDENNEENK